MKFSENARSVFVKNNFRTTLGVRKIFEIFENADHFLTVAELSEQTQLNPSSVYRILEKMVDTHLIHEFDGRFMQCSDPENLNEHHFLVCQKCDAIEEIFLDYKESIAKQLQKEKKFELHEVHLEFRGLCKNCN